MLPEASVAMEWASRGAPFPPFELTDESSTPIIVGTRGSDLALVQATATEAALAAAFPGREIVRKVITTTGDWRTDVSLADVAKAEGTFDKGMFIKEIEEALEAGDIDIAMHSLKNFPPFWVGRLFLERAPERAGETQAHSLTDSRRYLKAVCGEPSTAG